MDQVVTEGIHLARSKLAVNRVKGAMERVEFLSIGQAENRQGRTLSTK